VRVIVASDHAGQRRREAIRAHLATGGHEVVSIGPKGSDSADYPDFAIPAAERVAAGEFDRGVLICGTGMGMAIAANKVPGIRAATPYDEFTAEVSRKHNDTNVVCFGERSMDTDRTLGLLDIWMATGFEGGRHARRVEKIAEAEKRRG